jgi:hypothetical protein
MISGWPDSRNRDLFGGATDSYLSIDLKCDVSPDPPGFQYCPISEK